ncbi:hypothetical protein GCM10027430_13810 [Lysobacter tyrosinilyticus]
MRLGFGLGELVHGTFSLGFDALWKMGSVSLVRVCEAGESNYKSTPPQPSPSPSAKGREQKITGNKKAPGRVLVRFVDRAEGSVRSVASNHERQAHPTRACALVVQHDQ